MDVLTEEQHRALAFISAVNAGGYAPLVRDVEKWLDDPGSDIGFAHINYRGLLSRFRSTTSVIIDLGWVEQESSAGLRLTPLGSALLRSADANESEGVQVVVLDNEDPLAYSTLIGALAEVGDALLVDPYLDLQGTADLIEHTEIARALISDGPTTKRNRASIAVLLKAEEASVLEVRAVSGLHDRLVVAADGRVWTIGASMNGVARRKSVTVLTPMPKSAAELLTRQMMELWEQGELLAPPEDPNESTEATPDESAAMASP